MLIIRNDIHTRGREPERCFHTTGSLLSGVFGCDRLVYRVRTRTPNHDGIATEMSHYSSVIKHN